MPFAFLGVGLGGDDDQVGVLPVGDEGLLPRKPVGVAVAQGAGLDALHVRSGGGLGHGERADHLARHHLGQPCLFLRFGPIGEDIVCDDAGMDGIAPACQVGAALFQTDHRLMAKIAACAAICLGDGGAEQAQLARLLPGLAVHDPGLAPARVMGPPFIIDEFRCHLAEHPVLVGHPGHVRASLPLASALARLQIRIEQP
jgi:hypothetical protein